MKNFFQSLGRQQIEQASWIFPCLQFLPSLYNYKWYLLLSMFVEVEIKMQLPPKVTRRAFERLAEIIPANSNKGLRVAVEGGGCSGFQYNIELDTKHEDDLILENAGNKVFIDSTSLPFLSNATIDFSEELIGARFIIDNPNASSSCGCGTSFSI